MDREQEIRRFFLLQVNDALFPIGGYSHSQGLETYIQQVLQHFPEHRWNEQPGISHGFRRNEDYVAGCICTGVLYC